MIRGQNFRSDTVEETEVVEHMRYNALSVDDDYWEAEILKNLLS